jgi:hypothetical protein
VSNWIAPRNIPGRGRGVIALKDHSVLFPFPILSFVLSLSSFIFSIVLVLECYVDCRNRVISVELGQKCQLDSSFHNVKGFRGLSSIPSPFQSFCCSV